MQNGMMLKRLSLFSFILGALALAAYPSRANQQPTQLLKTMAYNTASNFMFATDDVGEPKHTSWGTDESNAIDVGGRHQLQAVLTITGPYGTGNYSGTFLDNPLEVKDQRWTMGNVSVPVDQNGIWPDTKDPEMAKAYYAAQHRMEEYRQMFTRKDYATLLAAWETDRATILRYFLRGKDLWPLLAPAYEAQAKPVEAAEAYARVSITELWTDLQAAQATLAHAQSLAPTSPRVLAAAETIRKDPAHNSRPPAKGEIATPQQQTNAALSEALKTPGGSELLMKTNDYARLSGGGHWKEVVDLFIKDQSVLLRPEPASRAVLRLVAPMVALSYQQLGDKRKAAYYYAVAAKIQAEISPQDPHLKEYLDQAAQLDPNNELLQKVRQSKGDTQIAATPPNSVAPSVQTEGGGMRQPLNPFVAMGAVGLVLILSLAMGPTMFRPTRIAIRKGVFLQKTTVSILPLLGRESKAMSDGEIATVNDLENRSNRHSLVVTVFMLGLLLAAMGVSGFLLHGHRLGGGIFLSGILTCLFAREIQRAILERYLVRAFDFAQIAARSPSFRKAIAIIVFALILIEFGGTSLLRVYRILKLPASQTIRPPINPQTAFLKAGPPIATMFQTWADLPASKTALGWVDITSRSPKMNRLHQICLGIFILGIPVGLGLFFRKSWVSWGVILLLATRLLDTLPNLIASMAAILSFTTFFLTSMHFADFLPALTLVLTAFNPIQTLITQILPFTWLLVYLHRPSTRRILNT